MADQATPADPGEQTAIEPALTFEVAVPAAPPLPLPFVVPTAANGRPVKTKVPPRRVYGDEITVEHEVGKGPNGEALTRTYYPHAGEWVEYLGSMTLDDYMNVLESRKLQAREGELKRLVAKLTPEVAASLTDADKELVEEAQAELAGLADDFRNATAAINGNLANLVFRCCWTNSRGEPVGQPTGEVDNDVPVCTVSIADLGKMETTDLGFWSDWSFGEMQATERGKD